MSKECRNDCSVPPGFPRVLDNRAALSHVDYRLGVYSDIREFMLRAIDNAEPLRAWTYRGSDDPGIALLEGAAVLGDILTFYQELYANEAYLRTAQWRESIADLVRLLGYRLSPGLGGNATFAFEIKGDAPVTIPEGLPLKLQLDPIAKQSDFQTSAEIVAYPWLSRFFLYRPLLAPPAGTRITELSIEAPDQHVAPIALKPGDRLLVGHANNPHDPSTLGDAEVVIVHSVREQHGARVVTIKGAMAQTVGAVPLTAYKLGRMFRHFGHSSAPKLPGVVSTTTTTSADGKSVTTNVLMPTWATTSFTRNLLSSTTSGTTPVSPSPLLSTEFVLDGDVNDLANGTQVLIQAMITVGTAVSGRVYLRTIVSTRGDAATWGTSAGRGTVVTVNNMLEEISAATANEFDIRRVQIHEVVSPGMQLYPWKRETSASSGTELYFHGTEREAESLLGRRVMLEYPGADPLIAGVVQVEKSAPSLAGRRMLRRVTLDSALLYARHSNTDPTVTVYGNIADATEGKLEPEIALGNGDAREIFQTFKVPKAPLTYHLAPGETPPEAPELTIWVNGRMWKRVPTLFGHSYDEEIYIVREDAEDQSWVQFGDGRTGARLPSGIRNITARYRTGSGAFGALKPETTVQPGRRIERLDKVLMPGVAYGGSEPEDGHSTREAAPGTFQSLDRLVSLRDFESETLAISGVARAHAAWRLVGSSPAVVLTVLMQRGRGGEIASVRGVIDSYNRCRGPRRHRVVVQQGMIRSVGLVLEVARDPRARQEDVESGIIAALGASQGPPDRHRSDGMFSVHVRRFGQAEYAGSVEGAVQRVDGVLWARVTGFASLGLAENPARINHAAVPLPGAAAVVCGADEMLGLYRGHLTIIYANNVAGGIC